MKVSYDNLTNPTQSLIDAFVNKLAGFAVKDNDNNTRFDLQVTSSLFNAKTNMVEVYFSLPEEFVKYVPEHIGETFDFHVYYNVLESLGRKISGSTTSWIYTFHRDVIFSSDSDRSFVVVLCLLLFLYNSEGFAFLICPYLLFVIHW